MGLTRLSHHEQLCAIGLEPALWQHTTIRMQTPDEMRRYIENALENQAAGTALPFVIVLQATGHIVGTTRYHSIAREHWRTEIGFSWVGLPWQRSSVNTEAKYLLLTYAFEQARCQRVEFKADTENESLCQALLRSSATRKGTLGQFMYSPHKGARTSPSSVSLIASGRTSKPGWSSVCTAGIPIRSRRGAQRGNRG